MTVIKIKTTEFEVHEITGYPDGYNRIGFMVIEYEVVKKEVNRYRLIFDDKNECISEKDL